MSAIGELIWVVGRLLLEILFEAVGELVIAGWKRLRGDDDEVQEATHRTSGNND